MAEGGGWGVISNMFAIFIKPQRKALIRTPSLREELKGIHGKFWILGAIAKARHLFRLTSYLLRSLCSFN